MNAVAFPEKARSDLQKILGLLDSNFEGERLAAIAAATRLLTRHGLRWSEILQSLSMTVIRSQDAPRRDGDDPSDGDPFGSRDWRDIAARCSQFQHLIDAWEERFLADVPRLSRLSVKQYNKLVSIVTRLRAAGCKV